MEKYIVIEIQTSSSGIVSTIATSYDDYNTAQQKFHTILAAAAVSQVMVHSAIIVDPTGMIIDKGSYAHKVE